MTNVLTSAHTKDTAVDKLVHMSHQDLYELCYYAHKDQYGFKGHHLARHSRAELASWYISHYDFNEKTQKWYSKLPLEW